MANGQGYSPLWAQQSRFWIFTIWNEKVAQQFLEFKGFTYSVEDFGKVTNGRFEDIIKLGNSSKTLVEYCLIRKEYGPKTGKVHWHGYIQFNKRIRGQQLKKWFTSAGCGSISIGSSGFEERAGDEGTALQGEEAEQVAIAEDGEESVVPTEITYSSDIHIEMRKGTIEEAISYIFKIGSEPWFEYGSTKYNENARIPIDWNNGETYKEKFNGKKGVLTRISEDIIKGASPLEIRDKYPGNYLQMKRNIQDMCEERRAGGGRNAPIGFWIWGPTATGKSLSAEEFTQITHQTCYHKDDTEWWQNYNHEDVVIINDISSVFPIRKLLRLLDHYDECINIKGSNAWFDSKFIIITCDAPPDVWCKTNNWFKNEEHDRGDQLIEQLLRRFKTGGGIHHLEPGTDLWGNDCPCNPINLMNWISPTRFLMASAPFRIPYHAFQEIEYSINWKEEAALFWSQFKEFDREKIFSAVEEWENYIARKRRQLQGFHEEEQGEEKKEEENEKKEEERKEEGEEEEDIDIDRDLDKEFGL